MFFPEHFLPDLERLLKQRFGLRVFAHGQVERSQVIETGGGVGMLFSEHFLPDLECSLQEGLSFWVFTDGLIEKGQIVE